VTQGPRAPRRAARGARKSGLPGALRRRAGAAPRRVRDGAATAQVAAGAFAESNEARPAPACPAAWPPAPLQRARRQSSEPHSRGQVRFASG
jgi:hypothetical protein